MDVFDKDKIKNNAIVNFADIQNKIANNTSRKEEVKTTLNIDPNSLQEKIEIAKKCATQEIEKFRKLTKDYTEDIDKLCVYEGLGEVLSAILSDLSESAERVVKGINNTMLSDADFRHVRASVYANLIKKYANKK